MNSDNPYSSPVIQAAEAIRPATAPLPLGTIARSTFLAWEKLRLIYIAILAAETLLLVLLAPGADLVTSVRFWGLVAEGAIAANVSYFAGPVIETYVTWLGFRAAWLRWALFVPGTMFSCLLVLAAMAGELLPTMD